ncbi:hypothetical protein HRTV-28_gp14 [Halorubrum tailed virus 28]|uniref:Uncharacterized protein n=1 Tax=Halorubrum tailed virus 28 TaxID=2878009 RepID=A0AAE8Y089_9CAUD|nr:hypothetical protein M1M39_gp15 [Halorubrum tailed virus 28]UBF23452.1 hypothetical protein HRTV-28_gp14 [Halorubrum tailed virus 28]
MAKKLEHDNGTVRDASGGDDKGDGVAICSACGKPHHPSLECTCGGDE